MAARSASPATIEEIVVLRAEFAAARAAASEAARAEAAETRALVEAMLTNLPVEFGLFDRHRRLVYAGRGIDSAEVLGAVRGAMPVGETTEARFRRTLPSGRQLAFTLRPLLDGYTLCVCEDDPQGDVRQRELEHARDELADVRRLMATALEGVPEGVALIKSDSSGGRQEHLVRTVRTAAEALLRIIDDMLDLPKIAAGRMDLDELPPGPGSTLADTMEQAVATAPTAKGERRHPTDALTTGTVLVVDDYPVNLDALMSQLENLGVPVDTASSGLEALAMWRRRPYALVLTDIHMPDMDGFELTRQIRAEEALTFAGRTPVVALTAATMNDEADRCLAAGMDSWLTRPPTLDRLRETIAQWMSKPAPPAAPPAAAAIDSVLDRAILKQIFGDHDATIDRLLACFAQAGAALVAQIAATGDDGERLADAARKLKVAAQAAGATRLGDAAATIEQSRDRGDLPALLAEWHRVQEALAASSATTSR